MRLNLLSIDLDWFNAYDYCGLKDRIRTFFSRLSEQCILSTNNITVLTDHHYMYPWAWELMRKRKASSVNIVNVDKHHDFYFLDSVSFNNSKTRQITCGNFFAFMAHEGILGTYDWVTSAPRRSLRYELHDFQESVSQAGCPKVRKVPNRTTVWDQDDVWYPIVRKPFDGLAVIKSPEFTTRYKTVLSAAEESLDNYFPAHKVRRHTCTKDYPYSSRRRIGMKRVA